MTVIASEKTPLLIKSLKDEVVLKISDDYDENNNEVSSMGLTYEELLPYIIDPYWIRIRKILFTLTCTAFFVILLAACIISFVASTECRNNLLSLMQPSLGDKSDLTNHTVNEISNASSYVFMNAEYGEGLLVNNQLRQGLI